MADGGCLPRWHRGWLLFLGIFCAVALQGCVPEEEPTANPFSAVFAATDQAGFRGGDRGLALARTGANILAHQSSGENDVTDSEDADASEDAFPSPEGDDGASSARRSRRRSAGQSFMQQSASRSREEQAAEEEGPSTDRFGADGKVGETQAAVETKDEAWMNGDGDVDRPRRRPPQMGKASFSALQTEDHKQQGELEDAYAKMLYLDNPDDVDKAEQLAWMKMQMEDKQFLKGGAGHHWKKPRPAPAPKRRTMMLNHQHSADSMSSWDDTGAGNSASPVLPNNSEPAASAVLLSADNSGGSAMLQVGAAAPPAVVGTKEDPYANAELADFF